MNVTKCPSHCDQLLLQSPLLTEKCSRCRDEEGPGPVPSGIKPELVELYQGVGTILKRFTTGKIPKAFKIIPKLSNWEEVCLHDV